MNSTDVRIVAGARVCVVSLLAAFCAVSLHASSSKAEGGAHLKIAGGHGAVEFLSARKGQLEKSAGATLETSDLAADAAFHAMMKGFVDAVAVGHTPEELVVVLDGKNTKQEILENCEWLRYSDTTVKAVLNPSNPVQAITREQMIGILTGSIKTWEPINGKKDEVKIYFNKAQTGAVQAVPRQYLGKDVPPVGNYVTNVKGLAKNVQASPGAIGFSGSKFVEEGFEPKFIATDAKIPYFIGAKKPLSPALQKIFAELKKYDGK